MMWFLQHSRELVPTRALPIQPKHSHPLVISVTKPSDSHASSAMLARNNGEHHGWEWNNCLGVLKKIVRERQAGIWQMAGQESRNVGHQWKSGRAFLLLLDLGLYLTLTWKNNAVWGWQWMQVAQKQKQQALDQKHFVGTICYLSQWRWVSQESPLVLKHLILLVKWHLKAQNTFIKNAFQG